MSGVRRVDLPPSSNSSKSSNSIRTAKSAAPGTSDRVSVFSRLGTKSISKPSERGNSQIGSVCRQWLETGHCQYGSKCTKVSTHTLVSPSKRSESVTASGPPSDPRIPAAKVLGKKKGDNNSPPIDPDWMNWDEKNLDFDDELMLERKRQLLERELAKQIGEESSESKAPGSVPPASLSALGSMAKKIKMVIPTAITSKKALPPATAPSAALSSAVHISGHSLSHIPGRTSSNSSSSSSSSSDSDSSSSTDSSSESSSEPSKKKSKTPMKKSNKRSSNVSDDKPKRKDKSSSDRKPLKSSKGGNGSKKTPAKSQVGGSKLARHRGENSSEKKKVRKLKKNRGSTGKRPLSPSNHKGSKRSNSVSGKDKDDRPQEGKSSTVNNPIRKGSERDKFGFYHAVAAPSQTNEGTSSGKDRGWKAKAGTSSSGTKRSNDQRRASLSPNRLSSEPVAKRHRKNPKPSGGLKRSLSSDRRGGGGSRPPSSPGSRRRSSHSPHGKRRTSPKSFSGAGASRSGSAGRDGRDRDVGRQAPPPRDERDHRDVRRDDGGARPKYDRDRKGPSGRNDGPSGGGRNDGPSGGGRNEGSRGNWDQDRRDDTRGGDKSSADRRPEDRDRYQGPQPPNRHDRHYKERGSPPQRTNEKERVQSPGARSGPRGQSPSSRPAPRGQSPSVRAAPSRGQSPSARSAPQVRRVKESAPSSSSTLFFSGGNTVRIEPRGHQGGTEHREKYPQHTRISRERERSPRERLLPAEALQRDRISRERERSPRDRLLPPEALQREKFSRERSPRDKFPQQNRFSRERERIPGSGAPSRERVMNEYPDRASPFERLGHHPLSQKRTWDGDGNERDFSKYGRNTSDPEEVSKARSSKSDSSETQTRKSDPKIELKDETVKPDSASAKDEVSASKPQPSSPSSNNDIDGFTAKEDVAAAVASPAQADPNQDLSTDVVKDEEAFSDLEIGDSDEEILNKINPNENEEEGQLQTSNEAVQDEEDETEEGEVGGLDSRSSSRKSNPIDADHNLTALKPDKTNSDLLEGISDEDLDISDDDEAKSKAKIADALGVDWTQLMTAKKTQEVGNATSQVSYNKKRWSVVSIFNRIGISKKFLGDNYDKIVEDINHKAEDGEKLELLHDIAGFHMRLKSLREKRRSQFASTGPYAGALTARRDIAIRRLMCNMIEDDPVEIPQPIHDMDLHRKAIELFRRGSRSTN